VGKSFIEAHHGRIWIESEGVGKGSKFIIELPIV
jgi:signal transduction histidine kinase